MYSSMHPLGGAVNRLERTLLNFFVRRGVKGGIFEALEGGFEVAARRRWAVLPRNSGVFEWREGAARRFRARRTLPGARGEKIFKNFLERSGKPKNWGMGGVPECGAGAPYIGCARRFLSLGARPLAALLGVHFVQVPQLQAPAMRSQRFAPLIYRGPACKLHRSLYEGYLRLSES